MWCDSIDYQCSLRFIEKRIKEKIYIILIYYLFYLWYEFFTDINVMYLIVIDGIIGLILMRDKKYN